jgi:DNA-binding NtrC family response regulator
MPHALIIDSDVTTAESIAALVAAEGFTTKVATTLAEARDALLQAHDVILLDVAMPGGNGLDLLREMPAQWASELIVTADEPSVESSLDALRSGASEYLVKPVDPAQLRRALPRVARAPRRVNAEAARPIPRTPTSFGALVGATPAMQRLYDAIERVAPTEATVLITGESGTGKEVVAQTIHEASRRRTQPFLAINCGAISPQLIETELFGHEKGSFTGASRQHRGFFERAHGGTLFLDEITEMPLDLQVKLLRVLETRTLSRIGSDEVIDVDVRVLAASNRPPQDAAAAGRLRRDLLYRLQVFPLHVPPLRERLQDVRLLATHFLDELNKGGGTIRAFTPAALDRLERYGWPGNVRELWNVVQRACILSEGRWITQFGLSVEATLNAEPHGRTFKVSVGDRIDAVEKRLILATVHHTSTREAAAKMLGVSVKTLYNRLRAYERGPVAHSGNSGDVMDRSQDDGE